jgi:hypothetical protein
MDTARKLPRYIYIYVLLNGGSRRRLRTSWCRESASYMAWEGWYYFVASILNVIYFPVFGPADSGVPIIRLVEAFNSASDLIPSLYNNSLPTQ